MSTAPAAHTAPAAQFYRLISQFAMTLSPEQIGKAIAILSEVKRLKEDGALMQGVLADQRVNPVTHALPGRGGTTVPPERRADPGWDALVAAGAVTLQPGG